MYLWFKRGADFVVAVILLVLFSPLIVILLAVIPRFSPGGPIYKQTRVGKNDKTFTVYKLRTRVIDTHDLEAKHRITSWENHNGTLGIYPFGAILRKFSLDELLQLINVIRGEMSLIGPRPLQPNEIEGWEEYDQRFSVRPGITGWAQVNGRDNLTTKKKFEHDVYYVENLSLWLDLIILIKTPFTVLQGTGH